MIRRGARGLAASLLLALPLAAEPRLEPLGGELRLARENAERFRARYCLEHEVTGLSFDRPIERMRASHWRPSDPAWSLEVAADGSAVLARPDGAPFLCAALELEVFTERPEASYYAFSPFGDGGVSVYTGYLIPRARRDGDWRATALAAAYVARPGERVVTRAADQLAEQFVYFGPQAPVEAAGLRAIVDPAMPAAARSRLLDTLPQVGALLARDFGFRPASPHLVFLATELDAFDGYSIKGGTLPGQILFSVKGREAAAEMAREPLRYARLAAHELFHLWQEEVWLGALGDDHPWVHEGSAEALAIEALRRADALDEGGYDRAWRDTESACAGQLERTSVHAGPGAGFFDVVYPCGALVNRLAGELLDAGDPGRGLVRLWRAAAARPEAERRGPSEPHFFATLSAFGVSEQRLAALRALLDWSGERPGFEERLSALRAPVAEPGGGAPRPGA